MAFMQGDNKYRPRSKKEKQRLQEQRKRELAAKRERQQRSQQAGSSFTPKYDYPQRNQHVTISSRSTLPEPATQETQKPEYTDEMAERERLAQAEANRRKNCIAPAFNKGPYQPVFTKDQARDIGR